MKRAITKELELWQKSRNRSPVLVRGARQVGKSYSVEEFGRTHFAHVLTVNFEFTPAAKSCFATVDPRDIVNKLQLLYGVTIDPDKTLVFLDEIQECPQAIKALRYFKEKMPDLAIIGAGSLLEFALHREEINFPVGRVSFMNLEPLSFMEFLDATGHVHVRRHLEHASLESPCEEVAEKKLYDLFRIYLLVGGMPAVVREYVESVDLRACQRLQVGLLETYRSDFGKYASLAQHKYLDRVFSMAPRLAGKQVKYAQIDDSMRSRDLKNALALLSYARIVMPVFASRASGLPLGAMINEKKFKVNFLDVGLMQNACGLELAIQQEKDLLQINAGAVAEQVVGQELRAYADVYSVNDQFFWSRDKKSSSAEVDYVGAFDGMIVPIEVKSGKTGRLRSLKIFLHEHTACLGVRVSQKKLSLRDSVLSVPLYMIGQLPRLVRQALDSLR
jgi:uncharacterized protein